jgi:hypothetical protein
MTLAIWRDMAVIRPMEIAPAEPENPANGHECRTPSLDHPSTRKGQYENALPAVRHRCDVQTNQSGSGVRQVQRHRGVPFEPDRRNR